jgi:ADP-ribosylglycohydrolase
MIGAIAGDIVGSRFEGSRAKTHDFELFHHSCRFTDDTVCTLAVASALLGDRDFARHLRDLGRLYPNAGYGGMFRQWLQSDDAPPYGSWGNGAPMRVASVGWLAAGLDDVDQLAELQSAVSHDHPDAIAASTAIARSIFFLRNGETVTMVKEMLTRDFSYDLSWSAMIQRPEFDITAKGTAQTALMIALEATDFEGAIREAALLGGDTDTLACIVGAVAEAIHGVPLEIIKQTKQRLPGDLLTVVEHFEAHVRGHDYLTRSPVITVEETSN